MTTKYHNIDKLVVDINHLFSLL